ncbi:hypothetical protein [Bacillus salacetis]|nr:hypothetical protein [Bacillus salacetis]
MILAILIAGTDALVFKLSGRSLKRRVISGIVLLLLTPVIFFLTAISISPFDEAGFGAGMIAVGYAIVYFINAVIVLIWGLLTNKLY